MDPLVAASHSFCQVAGCTGSPRAVEMRGRLGLAPGELSTHGSGAGQALGGLAVVFCTTVRPRLSGAARCDKHVLSAGVQCSQRENSRS